MKYVVAGSLGNISKPLSEKLIAAGHDVTIITSHQDKVKAIEALGARATVGSVEDVQFLKHAFKGADAVYTMVPPKWNAQNWKEWIGGIGQNYATAIKDAGVKFVVNLSSVGAHMPDGCGPVSGLYKAEQALNTLQGVNIKHLRPAYFYQNLLAQVGLVQHAGIMGANFGDLSFSIVHPSDITDAAAEDLLNLSFTGHSVRYIASDEVTGTNIASILGSAINKPDLKWIVFSDEDNLSGLLQAGLSEEVSKNYTEMGRAMRTGEMNEDYMKNKPVVGKIKLTDFATEFAAGFNA
ncbi:MAG TPA: NAD(P)H-binding protein [Parafilimonas sp.]|nr:NAD(P)H-binding protein [Parafilimonas sp.]